MTGRVLVTGGAGFIGSYLVEALVRDGVSVRVLDDFSTGSLEYLAAVRDAIEVVRGDITDLAVVRQAMTGVDAVVHEAAIRSIPRSLDQPGLCNQVNVGGTLNILVAAREAKVRRTIVASSSAVYGDAAAHPVCEDHPLHPVSPYAVSKLAGEWYAHLFRELYGLGVICLRYFTVFGPRMDATSGDAMAVPRFIAAMLHGEPPPVYGDGQQRRDFVFVEDVVQATRRALAVADGISGVFNVGAGQDHSLLELVAALNGLLQTRIAPRYLPARSWECRRTLADISRATAVLGYQPAVSFCEGLARTLAWYRQQSLSVAIQS